MNVFARGVFVVFGISCVGAVVALLSGVSWWRWVAAPALVFSGWAAAGHLITLDDDAPGEWSNLEKSRVIWYRSLAELTAKAAVFGGLVWFVLADWSR
jgi:hypothetical protein